jgi:hypothetical protein
MDTRTATIASGQSLSTAIDLGDAKYIGIIMPAVWDTAGLTFQASDEKEGTYRDVYDAAGTEYTVTAAAGRAFLLDSTKFAAWRFLKIRSGTAGTAVNQTAERKILVALKG